MSNFFDKNILITGCANGIGRDLVIQISKLGCKKIFLVDLDKTGLENLSTELNCDHEIIVTDLSSRVFEDSNLINIFNQNFIEIIICNAGLGGINPGDNFNEKINQKMMAVNYFGTTSIVSLALPKMILNKTGHIVGVASLAGLRGMPQAASYSASKSAQITFLESMRLDLRPYGINVTTVHPGFIKTRMTNHQEFKMPFMITSQQTATKIIKSILKNKRTVYFPFPINLLSLLNRFFPTWFYDRIILLLNPPQKKSAKIF